MKNILFLILTILNSLIVQSIHAVRLPRILSDNMLLQRESPIPIWGYAEPKEKVEVALNGHIVKARASKDGKWSVTFPAMRYGGPYDMRIKGEKNVITLENILIGDLWLCSGQSNMEGSVKVSNNNAEEIMKADYPGIRHFRVGKKLSGLPMDDFEGSWKECTPTDVGDFTAVGYYFARKLYAETGIPIGLVNASWGGTAINGWIDVASYSQLPENFTKYDVSQLETIIHDNDEKGEMFRFASAKENGIAEGWYKNGTDLSDWKSMKIPMPWSQTDLRDADGYVWYAYDFILPEYENSEAIISLGNIDDNDITWVNGTEIGRSNGSGVDRRYTISPGTLIRGQNRIVVRVHDSGGNGGVMGVANNDIVLICGKEKISLAGEWKYKESVVTTQFGYRGNMHNLYHSLIYNAMINPILAYAPIKGVIWYQGENDANDAKKYEVQFAQLIKGWRDVQRKNFPFYWVQLPNFMAKTDHPKQSNWAMLRQAQNAALCLPNTGQAVTIDIGEADEIHPGNKQDVGLRLALIALNKLYGFDKIEYSGPVYKSMERLGNKIIIEFESTSPIVINNKYGYIEGFALAGSDGKFRYAKAYLECVKVVVHHNEIPEPEYVRFCWDDNPDVNLYNESGLPGTPFRSDDLEK